MTVTLTPTQLSSSSSTILAITTSDKQTLSLCLSRLSVFSEDSTFRGHILPWDKVIGQREAYFLSRSQFAMQRSD